MVTPTQQSFFEGTDINPVRDLNRFGCYCGTTSKVAPNAPTLSNINMSPVKKETRTVVLDLTFFKPNEDQTDVVASIKDWAAMLFATRRCNDTHGSIKG